MDGPWVPGRRSWTPEELAATAMSYAPDVRTAVGAGAASVGLDVDAVVREAITRVLDHLEDIRSEHHVRPWLIVLARRIIVDHARTAYWRRVHTHVDAR